MVQERKIKPFDTTVLGKTGIARALSQVDIRLLANPFTYGTYPVEEIEKGVVFSPDDGIIDIIFGGNSEEPKIPQEIGDLADSFSYNENEYTPDLE